MERDHHEPRMASVCCLQRFVGMAPATSWTITLERRKITTLGKPQLKQITNRIKLPKLSVFKTSQNFATLTNTNNFGRARAKRPAERNSTTAVATLAVDNHLDYPIFLFDKKGAHCLLDLQASAHKAQVEENSCRQDRVPARLRKGLAGLDLDGTARLWREVGAAHTLRHDVSLSHAQLAQVESGEVLRFDSV